MALYPACVLTAEASKGVYSPEPRRRGLLASTNSSNSPKGKLPDVPRQLIEMALLGLQSLHRPLKGQEWVESGGRNIMNAAQLRLVPSSWAGGQYIWAILSPFALPVPDIYKKKKKNP